MMARSTASRLFFLEARSKKHASRIASRIFTFCASKKHCFKTFFLEARSKKHASFIYIYFIFYASLMYVFMCFRASNVPCGGREKANGLEQPANSKV